MSTNGLDFQKLCQIFDLSKPPEERKQLEEGTASAAVITHYLKLGTVKEKLELEKLKKENELLVAKAENLQTAKKVEELYVEAMEAFKGYRSSADAVE